jgi:uroporphyrinogen decarboxylase
MNKRERLICALKREQPDQVPLYDLVDHSGVLSRFGGRQLTLENAAEVIPQATQKILDTTRIWLPEAPGRRVDGRGFVYERVDWWNEWRVETPYQDDAGMLAFIKRDIERIEAWQPEDQAKQIDELKGWQARYGDVVLPASMTGEALQDAYILLGIDHFIYRELDEPELIARWVDAQHQATLRRLQAEDDRSALSPVAWVFADIAYKEHLMFSKRYLKTNGYFRRLAEIMDIYHSQGLLVIFHSDGDITSIVAELIDAGADAIAPVDIPAGMDIARLKEDFGTRLSFVGGLNLGLLSAGTPDDVRAETLRVIRAAGKGGGLVLGSSSEEIYETVPEQNILTMWETAWEYGKYPLG